MKKFLKGCGITALIFLIIGILFTTIVYFTKGGYFLADTIEDSLTRWGLDSFYDFGLRKNINKSLNVSIDDFEYDELYNIDDNFIFDDNHEIYKGKIDKEFSQEINDLNFDVGGCEFEIKESVDNAFRIEGKNVEKLQAYVENNTLYIKTITTKWKNISSFKSNCIITLSIPKGYKFNEVDMSFGAGDVELGYIAASKVELEIGASDVRGSIVAEEVKASVGAGQLQIEEMEITNLEVSAGAGSFYGSGRINGNAEISCSAGSAELELDAEFEDYNYDVECTASQVSIGDRSYTKMSEDFQINNESMREITLDASMATIDVYFNN